MKRSPGRPYEIQEHSGYCTKGERDGWKETARNEKKDERRGNSQNGRICTGCNNRTKVLSNMKTGWPEKQKTRQ